MNALQSANSGLPRTLYCFIYTSKHTTRHSRTTPCTTGNTTVIFQCVFQRKLATNAFSHCIAYPPNICGEEIADPSRRPVTWQRTSLSRVEIRFMAKDEL
jgi:hypothetical protein